MIDTHTHISDTKFDALREEIVGNFARDGIEAVIDAACDRESAEKVLQTAARFERVYCALGVHPHDARNYTEADGKFFLERARWEKVVALGEIGLDYHYDLSPRAVQKTVFAAQLEAARVAALPVIVHSRDADADTADILRAHRDALAAGFVMHCFAGDVAYAGKVLDMGGYISFAGPLTFKRAERAAAVAAYAPSDRFLIETDCPYLSPEPLRGQTNVPANARYVAEKLAAARGASFAEIDAQSSANARRLFAKLR